MGQGPGGHRAGTGRGTGEHRAGTGRALRAIKHPQQWGNKTELESMWLNAVYNIHAHKSNWLEFIVFPCTVVKVRVFKRTHVKNEHRNSSAVKASLR